jgi:hypothetical protein
MYLRTRASGTWVGLPSEAILDISLRCRQIHSTTCCDVLVSNASGGVPSLDMLEHL